VPEVFQFGSTEVTFVRIKPKADVTKSAKDLGQMLQMVIESRANDDDVVQVYKYMRLKFGPENAVQQPLEGSGRGVESERHYPELHEPTAGHGKRRYCAAFWRQRPANSPVVSLTLSSILPLSICLTSRVFGATGRRPVPLLRSLYESLYRTGAVRPSF